MTLAQLLTLLGLVANLIALVISIRKFDILENILLFHWKAVTAWLTFTMLSFLMWFSEEIVELFFFSTFKELFEQILYVTMLLLLICSQITFAYALLKGVRLVDA